MYININPSYFTSFIYIFYKIFIRQYSAGLIFQARTPLPGLSPSSFRLIIRFEYSSTEIVFRPCTYMYMYANLSWNENWAIQINGALLKFCLPSWCPVFSHSARPLFACYLFSHLCVSKVYLYIKIYTYTFCTTKKWMKRLTKVIFSPFDQIKHRVPFSLIFFSGVHPLPIFYFPSLPSTTRFSFTFSIEPGIAQVFVYVFPQFTCVWVFLHFFSCATENGFSRWSYYSSDDGNQTKRKQNYENERGPRAENPDEKEPGKRLLLT